MKKWRKEFEVHQKTADIQCEEDWQKRMAHGHYCPYCKAEIIDASNCAVTYLIPMTVHNAARLGKKILFNRLNRRVSCPDCVREVVSQVSDPYTMEKLISTIRNAVGTSNGRVKEIHMKAGDGYREMVFKKNGIDPAMKPNYVIYNLEDKVGEAEGAHKMFLGAFNVG